MLAFVAVLFAGLLGMAALTIDLGHATMQQQRLESFADASSMVALRHEALLRFQLALNPSRLSEWGCSNPDTPTGRDTCIEDRVQSSTQVSAAYAAVLPNESDRGQGLAGAEVSLGPSRPEGRPLPCGALCWQTQAAQRVPLLFGQGSNLRFNPGDLSAMMDARARGQVFVENDGQALPSIRTQGITIKANTRAETQPVVRVGSPVTGTANQSGLPPGRAPFALELNAWRLAGVGGSLVLIENGTGTLAGAGSSQNPPGRRLLNGEALRAGLALAGTDNGQEEAWTPLQDADASYVPLFVKLDETDEELVIGFGFATLDWAENLQTLTVTPLESQLAPANATASPRLWVGGQAGITNRIDQVLALRGNNGNLLQAPVLQ